MYLAGHNIVKVLCDKFHSASYNQVFMHGCAFNAGMGSEMITMRLFINRHGRFIAQEQALKFGAV